MLKTRIMPCLLVDDDRLVKTVKFKDPAYVGDPVNAIKIYNEKEVDELIVLDITATAQKRPPNLALIRDIANECFMPLTYGGGIQTIEQVRDIFTLGVEKVAVNAAAHDSPSLITAISERYGAQSIVASIDVKKSFFGKHEVWTRSGAVNTKKTVVEYAVEMEKAGAGELLVYSMDRDGTWDGFDLDLIKKVTDAVSVPVIACGGAGSLSHIEAVVKQSNASAVALGSMAVYQNKGLGVLITFPKRRDIEALLS